MLRLAYTVLAVLVTGGVCGCASVRVVRSDLENDGEQEVVLENEYLRVVAMHPRTHGVKKHRRRFVWGGRIVDLVFKPTGRNYVIPTYEGRQETGPLTLGGSGLPDQFDKQVPFTDVDGNTRRLLIGVGVVDNRGRPVATPQWEFWTEDLAAGGKAACFRQRLRTEAGPGYELVRRLLLHPHSAGLTIETTLVNTGTTPLDTDWYLHPFWRFHGDGMTPWQVVPLALGPDGPVRVEAYDLPATDERIGEQAVRVFGWLRPDEVGHGSFLATGGRGGDNPFFGLCWDFPLLRLRTWIHGATYALEPCTKIDLEPGERTTLRCHAVLGAGLDGATAVQREGAVRLQPLGEGRLKATWLPAAPTAATSVEVKVVDADGKPLVSKTVALAAAAPDAPAGAVVDLGGLPVDGSISATVALADGGGARAVRPIRPGLAAGPLDAGLRGRSVLLVGDPENRKRARELAYLSAALKWAGARVRHAAPHELPADLDGFDVVALLGVTESGTPERLAAYVRKGGGLFVAAPLAGDLAGLLPVQGEPDLVEYSYYPRVPVESGHPRAENIPAERAHLQAAGAHPITAGLPFHPATNQCIGRLWQVQPRAGARVLLRYTRPESPALVLDAEQRVAVLLSPVGWGTRPAWILWGTVGEYHRALLLRTLAWCANPNIQKENSHGGEF